jgi:hypothetical protein
MTASAPARLTLCTEPQPLLRLTLFEPAYVRSTLVELALASYGGHFGALRSLQPSVTLSSSSTVTSSAPPSFV